MRLSSLGRAGKDGQVELAGSGASDYDCENGSESGNGTKTMVQTWQS